MTTYDERVQAVQDATRLVRAVHEAPERGNSPAFQAANIGRPPLDLFDVLEVARFLLNEDDVPAPCPTCNGGAP